MQKVLSPKKRHIPKRMCLICGQKRPKKDLWRLALNERGYVFFDPKQVSPGRGAYVCPEDTCIAKLFTKHGEKRLRHAFKGRARGLTQKTIEALMAALESREGGTG